MKTTVYRVHELKLNPEYYEAIKTGAKRGELRPADRDFKVGDYLELRPFEPRKPDAHFQDASLVCLITHVLDRNDPFGKKSLRDGWVMLSIDPCIDHDAMIAIRHGAMVKVVAPRVAAKKRRR